MLLQLKQTWYKLIQSFSDDNDLAEKLWLEIVEQYSHKNRAYHNLHHIQSMLQECSKFEPELQNPELVKLAIWYHDLIYDAKRKDNELKSAERAKAVLQLLHLEPTHIQICYDLIMVTKSHQLEKTSPADSKYLVDFDLEVLSRSWEDYQLYSEQIRKEYWIYPGPLYRRGRKKALLQFLEREYIYQTEYYRTEREAIARENIEREINTL